MHQLSIGLKPNLLRDRPSGMDVLLDAMIRHSLAKLGAYLHRHLVLVLISISLCALILFPIADCFDCNGPNPWGRNDATYAIRSAFFDYWLVGSSLLAGLLRRRFGWMVPIAITVIACATQPLGGVALWSLVNNEGPVMLIYGVSIGVASFFVGLAARLIADSRRKNRTPASN
jgi:O-antigen/teichoic acid export membrane protein